MYSRRLDTHLGRALFIASLLTLAVPAWAAATEEELFFKDISEVNEGELRFLSQAPAKPVHHHQNRIIIDDASLESGWIHLEQCHAHLDAVPKTQIVYRDGFVRSLSLVRHSGIDKVWVDGASVQLENVQPGAVVCIKADTLALSPLEEGGHFLRNGPYMRRFLDGYYPMRVSLSVHLATNKLRFTRISPSPQEGFQVLSNGHDVDIEAVFEGRLQTEMRFDLVKP